MTIRLRTYAKVNLYLAVGARRPDGYHDIDTVFQTVSLYDDLAIDDAEELSVSMTLAEGVAGEPPPPGEDLVTRAARALAPGRGAALAVTKRIPLGAGLAGGSANAAGALVGLNRLWRLGLGDDELGGLAAVLGSDVPFCLVGGLARARGRGELVEPVRPGPPCWLVLGISERELSTAAVYAERDRLGPTRAPDGGAAVLAAAAAGDARALAPLLRNDLAEAVRTLRPEVAAGEQALLKAGALAALVCGSGPTVLGLCEDAEHAAAVAAACRGAFARVEVASFHPVGVEPATNMAG
jgi:4-diphosphocytidyl-2-C-methyl-D-erythritol kinase